MSLHQVTLYFSILEDVQKRVEDLGPEMRASMMVRTVYIYTRGNLCQLSNRENVLMFPHYWPCVFGAVFLGGSCNPTSWRKDIVIPRLLKEGISFYNPVSLLSLSLL